MIHLHVLQKEMNPSSSRERGDAYLLATLAFGMLFVGAYFLPTHNPHIKSFYFCNLAGLALSYFSFRRKRNLYALILFPWYAIAVFGQLFGWYYGVYKGTWTIGS